MKNISLCLPYTNYIIGTLRKSFIESEFKKIEKYNKIINNLFINFETIDSIKVFTQENITNIRKLIKHTKNYRYGGNISIKNKNILIKKVPRIKINSIFNKINTIEEKLAIILYIFFNKRIFNQNFFMKYTNNYREGGSTTKRSYNGVDNQYNKKQKKGISEIDTDKTSDISAMENDFRRKLVIVTIISTIDNSYKQFCIKLSVNTFFLSNYEKEIEIYKSFNTLQNTDCSNLLDYIVKYIPSNNIAEITFDTNLKQNILNIDIDNNNVKIDIDDHIIKMNNKHVSKNIVYLITEYRPDFLNPISIIKTITDTKFEFINKVCENTINIMYNFYKKLYFYHGDLKFDNILCNENGDVVIFDFDFSGFLNDNPCKIEEFKNNTVTMNFNFYNPNTNCYYFNLTSIYPQIDDLPFLFFFDIYRFILSGIDINVMDNNLEVLNNITYINSYFKKLIQICVKKSLPLLKTGSDFNKEPMLLSRNVYEEYIQYPNTFEDYDTDTDIDDYMDRIDENDPSFDILE